MTGNLAATVGERVLGHRDALIQFLREICAIPSMESQIGPVGERVAAEMRKLRFDDVRFDRMGNVFGRMGDGARILVLDSHIDTVGIGDPSAWAWDPFQGKVENGILYARGACDEKGSTPGMVYAPAIMRDLGILDGWRGWLFHIAEAGYVRRKYLRLWALSRGVSARKE